MAYFYSSIGNYNNRGLMSKFFDKIKDAFSTKKTQKYKIYDGQ